MLRASGLCCERDRRQLFSALDVSLDAGQLVQVTGRNGSGKTTLLKILSGLYTDFEGEVAWSIDRPPLYLGHSPGVNPRLTVTENLNWLCHLQDTDPAAGDLDDVLSVLGMAGYQDTLCHNLSEGQRKRVNLARFLLCENACWIMDEPFSSIDTAGLRYLEDRMQGHLERGGGIILTSHQRPMFAVDIQPVALSS